MKNGKNKLLFILGGIALIIFSIGKVAPLNNSAEPTTWAIGEGTGKSAISVMFADANFNPIALDYKKQSIVFVQGQRQPGDIYYMRFNFTITNSGTAKNVKITNIWFEDCNSSFIENDLSTSFGCILNINQNIGQGASYTYSTMVGGSCGSETWIPTTPFERYCQPVKLKAKVHTEYPSSLGVSRVQDIVKEFSLQISNSSYTEGGIDTSILSGSSQYLTECSSGQQANCPGANTDFCSNASSCVCYGKYQTCAWNITSQTGLWPGCPDSIYGGNYTPSIESNTISGKDFTYWCKDNLDNDCDGKVDKPLITGLCPDGNAPDSPSAKCDGDCPSGVVFFRTNANVKSYSACTTTTTTGLRNCISPWKKTVGPTDTNTNISIWFSYNYSNTSMNSYGLSLSSNQIQTASNPTCAQIAARTSAVGYYWSGIVTPVQNLPIYLKSGSTDIYLAVGCEATLAGWQYIRYSLGYSLAGSSLCNSIHPDYSGCVSKKSLESYSNNSQEVLVNY